MASAPVDKILALLSGYQWPGTPVTTTTIKFTFLTSVPSYYGTPGDVTYPVAFTPFNSQQEFYARQALALWSEVSKINFVEETNPLLSDITFGNRSVEPEPSGPVYGRALYPTLGGLVGGDVWLNINFDPILTGNSNPAPGTTGFETLMHEIGHALGLKHPFEDGVQLPGSENHTGYTLMSATHLPQSPYVRARTAMLYDIAAIQSVYGINTLTRVGNTIYTFSTTAAQLETIWDAGGNDTIDASNQTLDVTIDLNEGHFSSIGPEYAADPNFAVPGAVKDNVAIAFGTQIENALGGSGDDLLIGNDTGNELTGNAGSDTLRGGAGHDTYLFTGVANEGGSTGDTIIDDGNGDAIIIGTQLQGTFEQVSGEPGQFAKIGDTHKVHFYGRDITQASDLSIKHTGGEITVRDWSQGKYGITLAATGEARIGPATGTAQEALTLRESAAQAIKITFNNTVARKIKGSGLASC